MVESGQLHFLGLFSLGEYPRCSLYRNLGGLSSRS